MENTPQTLPLPAAETRCLGHCEQRKTICQLQEACARQVTIRNRNEPISTDVRHHMCGAGGTEFFVPINHHNQ